MAGPDEVSCPFVREIRQAQAAAVSAAPIARHWRTTDVEVPPALARRLFGETFPTGAIVTLTNEQLLGVQLVDDRGSVIRPAEPILWQRCCHDGRFGYLGVPRGHQWDIAIRVFPER